MPTPPDATPRVFISWAHRSADDPTHDAWRDQVFALAQNLREFGVKTEVDLYHLNDADIDWQRFGPNQVDESDFVLAVVDHRWRERWEGANAPSEGAGAVGEANALRSIFADNQALFRRKLKLVMMPGVPDAVVPRELHGIQRIHLAGFTETDLQPLLRIIYEKPEYVPATLGSPPVLEPRRLPPDLSVANAKFARSEIIWVSDGMVSEISEALAWLQDCLEAVGAGAASLSVSHWDPKETDPTPDPVGGARLAERLARSSGVIVISLDPDGHLLTQLKSDFPDGLPGGKRVLLIVENGDRARTVEGFPNAELILLDSPARVPQAVQLCALALTPSFERVLGTRITVRSDGS